MNASTACFGGRACPALTWAGLLLCLALGCAAEKPLPGNVQHESARILPGDELEIEFFYVPELSVTQFVREDGLISMYLVGEVVAAHKTPKELAEDLRARYEPLLVNSEVSVFIRSVPMIQVTGEVVDPGPHLYWTGMTVLEAIMQAGGFKADHADIDNVRIIHREPGGRTITSVDLSDLLDEDSDEEPIHVRRMDIIYVPPKRPSG